MGANLSAMKKLAKIWPSIMFVGYLLTPVSSEALQTATRQTFEEPGYYMEPTPASAADYMPWYAIPNRFLFSGGYYADLSITELKIDHVSQNSKCTRKNRTFMISASYETPVGTNFFSTRMDVPLLFADRFSVTRLAPASVGDYVLHLSNSPMEYGAGFIRVSTRF
jgi:hypothetical protein